MHPIFFRSCASSNKAVFRNPESRVPAPYPYEDPRPSIGIDRFVSRCSDEESVRPTSAVPPAFRPPITDENKDRLFEALERLRSNAEVAIIRSMVWRNPLLQAEGDHNILGGGFWKKLVAKAKMRLPILMPLSQLPDKLKHLIENREHFG